MKEKFTLCLLLISTIVFGNSYQQPNDSAAIKTLLEKESSTWRSGDAKEYAACWHIQPYSRVLVSLANGTTIDVPPAMMVNPAPGSMGGGGTSANSNYTFSINGNTAWVSHNETSTSKEGKKSYSYEIRLLEKIDGEWKLVGQSIHLYNPA